MCRSRQLCIVNMIYLVLYSVSSNIKFMFILEKILNEQYSTAEWLVIISVFDTLGQQNVTQLLQVILFVDIYFLLTICLICV